MEFLQFYCCMDLIAATRAEGGLVWKKRAVKYCHLKGVRAVSVFLLDSTNVHAELQPIGLQRNPLSFSNNNTLLYNFPRIGIAHHWKFYNNLKLH